MKKIKHSLLILLLPLFMMSQIRVVCVGNSITAGYTLSDPGTQAWPAQLNKMLGSKYSVLNCGVSGTTMLKKAGSPYWNTGSFTNAKNFNPDILIISLGTNDAHPSNWIYKNDFYNDYAAMIDEFRQNGRNPKIYVCLPATNFGDTAQINNTQNEVIPFIRQISLNKNATIIDFNTPTKNQRNTLFNDNLHPNAAGALVLANTAFNIITAALPTFYHDCTYGGYAIKLGIGDYNFSALSAQGISNDDISSIKVPAGYKVIGYANDNFSGNSITLTSDNTCLGTWDNVITSIKVRANGVTGKNGTYSLQNRKSGKYMDVYGGSLADGAAIIQWNGSGANNQQFTFTDVGDGAYKITSVLSGKALDIGGGNTNNVVNLTQWTSNNGLNQQYILLATDNGFYKLKAAHSGRIIEVYGGYTTNGENLNQYDDNNQLHGQWSLTATGSALKKASEIESLDADRNTILNTDESNKTTIFPNPSSNIVTVTNVPAYTAIVVLDMNGQAQLKLKSLEKSNDFKIDISSLKRGTYFIRIGENNKQALKFIKN
ncbi:putative secreted protein (Por secretion system target) [Flavobacterium sp. 270]|uniref:RICIN domain-containing protein n=1 Tax=Flavobacterium sp. 270 TaxID=2512114 RepID=UPI00106628D0|nr:RICIN domain-containing protein [Flavobacterium sp. 270]TDW48129.1 putative secreted protein (Por secretion system target) [Flavobacterium sp. 270]